MIKTDFNLSFLENENNFLKEDYGTLIIEIFKENGIYIKFSSWAFCIYKKVLTKEDLIKYIKRNCDFIEMKGGFKNDY
jgi:hypothetical protein